MQVRRRGWLINGNQLRDIWFPATACRHQTTLEDNTAHYQDNHYGSKAPDRFTRLKETARSGILSGADLTAKGQGKGANTQRAGIGSCRPAPRVGRHLPRYPFCCARSAGSVESRPRPITDGCWQLGFKPCCTGACRVTDPKTVNGDGRATHLPEILFLKIDHRLEQARRDPAFLGGLLPSGFLRTPNSTLLPLLTRTRPVEHQVSASIERFLPVCGGLPRLHHRPSARPTVFLSRRFPESEIARELRPTPLHRTDVRTTRKHCRTLAVEHILTHCAGH
jgi:hypothetical protein